MSQQIPTSEVLNRAADLIEERGWKQGSWDADGGLCLEGAINAARGMEGEVFSHCPAADAVRTYLGERFLWSWNDMLGHTPTGWFGGSAESAHEFGRQRVVEVLRATAVIEAAREEQDAAFATYAEQVSA